MYAAKRPFIRPALLFFIGASLLLAACSGSFNTGNWPGLSTDGEKVYVAYGPRVLAYNVPDQDIAWTFPEEASRVPIFAAPSVEDGRVILGDFGAPENFFSSNVKVTVYALGDVESGAPDTLWAKDGVATASIIATPLQIGEQIFIGTADNRLLSLDAADGSLQWAFETDNSIWGAPAYKNGVLYVASLDRKVYAIEADTGDEVWDTPVELAGALASQPVVNTDLVYVTSFDGQLHALSIETGEQAWSVVAEDWIWGAPTFVTDVVYFADVRGNVYAVDANDGEELWMQSMGYAVQTSPVVVDETVYIAAEGNAELGQGTLTALSIEDGQQRWQRTTSSPIYTTPVVVDNLMVVALASETELLIGFDLETGDQRWVLPPPAQ